MTAECGSPGYERQRTETILSFSDYCLDDRQSETEWPIRDLFSMILETGYENEYGY